MNFFEDYIIPESNHPIYYWAYAGGEKDRVERFHPLYYLYSMLHILLPKSDDPNIVYEEQEIHPVIHDNDIWSPKQDEHLKNLRYVNSFDILPYNKNMKFIETGSSCIRNAGF